MAGYKCTTRGCYSYQSPETNALFLKLQTQINQFAQMLAFTPLKTPVDGIIGKGTTEAALLVLMALSEVGPVSAQAAALESGINSQEQLAANAQAVSDVLALALKQPTIAKSATPATPPPAPRPTPSTTQLATTSANAPVKSTSPATQQALSQIQSANPALKTGLIDRMPPWAAYASGGLLVFGTLALVGFVLKRGGRAAAAAPAAAPVSGAWNPGPSVDDKVRAYLSNMRPGQEIDADGMARAIKEGPYAAHAALMRAAKEGYAHTDDERWYSWSPRAQYRPGKKGVSGAPSLIQRNREGMSYYEWWRAAGFTRQPHVSTEAYRAWKRGEDPTDWHPTRFY